MSYLNLVRQIEIGTEKGHTESEITEAVIRAVSPGLPLRDMLEIKRGLTLPALLTILRGHYKVDSSTDLYHQLINLSQDPKETALNFVVRAIEIKEKLLWKAENEDAEEHYSRAIIQRKFLRSIETGLLSDNTNTTVTVKAVKGKENKNEQAFSTQQMMEELCTEMKQILSAVLEASHHPPLRRPRLKGCQKCRNEGAGDNCSHCFKCGLDGHFSRGCRAHRQLPENRSGLPGRDHQ